MKNNEKGFSAVYGLLFLIIVGLVSFTGWYVWQRQSETKASTTVSTNSQSAGSPTTSSSEPIKYGTIKGDASYPSSGLPSDESVCAVSISDTTKVYCDKEVGARFAQQDTCQIGESDCNKPAPDTSYSIKVPVGDYYVYATAESRSPGYKAYYNEFSKCGLSVDCPEAGHKQYIKITITANATVNNINPGDWYDR